MLVELPSWKDRSLAICYTGGREFCLSRRFQVESERCFTFDEKLDTSSSSNVHSSGSLFLFVAMVTLSVMSQLPASEAWLLVPTDVYRRSRKKRRERDEIPTQTKHSAGVKNMDRAKRKWEDDKLRKFQDWKYHHGLCLTVEWKHLNNFSMKLQNSGARQTIDQ